MTIICIEGYPHTIESQPRCLVNWMGEGWAEVPEELEREVFETLGYCDIEVLNGVLVDFVPREIPDPKPEPEDDRDTRMTELEQTVAAAMDFIVPNMVQQQVMAAAGDAAQLRPLASSIAPLTNIMSEKEWALHMTTDPGDLVRDPDGKRVYLFTESITKTHTNPLFYPGAAGVHYWLIVPEVYEGIKVYPDVPGIIVAVKHGEPWWNTDKSTAYEWIGADNNACNWLPGTDPNVWRARP